MMEMITGKRKSILFFFLFVSCFSSGQKQSGKIVYERKTNLEKKFKDWEGEWIKEFLATNKYKVELFDLNFNDSISYFKPTETEEQDPTPWTTNRNSTFQNFNSKIKYSLLNVGGEEAIIKDVITNRDWKITDSKRMIGMYECRKAFLQIDDTTKIYAWFSNEILPSVGPEGFCGLPGAILGLATEDGGVVYFAKTVQLIDVNPVEVQMNIKKKKIFTMDEFRVKLSSIIDDTPEDKKIEKELFKWL